MIRLGPSLSTSVDQRPVQGLAMSAQLAQAIGMLSMDGAEIDTVVAEHVERNPFLARIAASPHAELSAVEAMVEAVPSANERLERQIALAFRDPAERALARALGDELDDAGYLRAPPPELAARFGVDEVRLERVLTICRTFEPSGVFARDLTDCLALQLAARGMLDAPMRALLANLPLLASGDLAAVRRATALDGAGLRERLRWLRACDPKPGADLAASAPSPRKPVARILRDPAGGWRVRLLPSANPRVVVDDAYARRIAKDASAAGFARDAMREARWLERALDQRARSILLVVEEIARRQAGFLERGGRALCPLSMHVVGEAIGLHESTVSRVCAGKSVETPSGTVPLRSMFGSGVETNDGALSASAVQHRIRELVAAERPDAILSDDALKARLEADGVRVARRTVAKYREAMAIGSSAVRRRLARSAIV